MRSPDAQADDAKWHQLLDEVAHRATVTIYRSTPGPYERRLLHPSNTGVQNHQPALRFAFHPVVAGTSRLFAAKSMNPQARSKAGRTLVAAVLALSGAGAKAIPFFWTDWTGGDLDPGPGPYSRARSTR